MREFNYTGMPQGAMAKEVYAKLLDIVALKNRLLSNPSIKPEVLTAMTEVAKAQSTAASNRIEGIRTSDARLKRIMAEKTDPRSRDEQEIAGYRDVLNTIHESWEYIDVTPNVILQLHRNLYRHTPSAMGGHFKVGDNVIRGRAENGIEYTRFAPPSSVVTPIAMDNLCSAIQKSLQAESNSGLGLLCALEFVFDFTCVHPFNDSNGRMSRLLTLLLMHKLDFNVGHYVSIERIIEETKDDYYDALELSSSDWREGTNDPSYFILYMLMVIERAYAEFARCAEVVMHSTLSKPERIEAFLSDSLGRVTKANIAEANPDISVTTIERTLHDLLLEEKVRKVGTGRSTGYVWQGIRF